MKLTTEIFGRVIVIHTPEELNDDCAERFAAFVTCQQQSQVIVEMDNTELIDSSGLESLLVAQQSLRNVNGDLKITTTNKTNRKILEITRLDQQFEVYESVIDAVKSFA